MRNHEWTSCDFLGRPLDWTELSEGTRACVLKELPGAFPAGRPAGAVAYVFGSVARATDTERSDTDVAVFVPGMSGYEVRPPAADSNVELHLVGEDRWGDPTASAVVGATLDGIPVQGWRP